MAERYYAHRRARGGDGSRIDGEKIDERRDYRNLEHGEEGRLHDGGAGREPEAPSGKESEAAHADGNDDLDGYLAQEFPDEERRPGHRLRKNERNRAGGHLPVEQTDAHENREEAHRELGGAEHEVERELRL